MNQELCDFCTFPEYQVVPLTSEQTLTCLPLRKCLGQVISELRPGLIGHSDTVINDIQPELVVCTQKETLLDIMTRLLKIVVDNSLHNIIHLSAKTVGSITLLHIRNSHAEYNNQIAAALQEAEPLAESLGGCVTISNNRMYGLSLAFTFLNH